MALLERKKGKVAEDTAQKVVTEEISETDVSFVTATEATSTKEEPKPEEPVSEKPSVSESSQVAQEDLSSGVILYGKKVSGFLRRDSGVFFDRYSATRTSVCLWYPRYYMHAYFPAPGGRFSHISTGRLRDIIHPGHCIANTVSITDNIPAYYR